MRHTEGLDEADLALVRRDPVRAHVRLGHAPVRLAVGDAPEGQRAHLHEFGMQWVPEPVRHETDRGSTRARNPPFFSTGCGDRAGPQNVVEWAPVAQRPTFSQLPKNG